MRPLMFSYNLQYFTVNKYNIISYQSIIIQQSYLYLNTHLDLPVSMAHD